jgi:hypothetical protein
MRRPAHWAAWTASATRWRLLAWIPEDWTPNVSHRSSRVQWCWSVAGPHGIGKQQSRAGTSGHDGKESQATVPSRPGPRALEHGRRGFEPYPTLPRAGGPRQRCRRRLGQASPCGRVGPTLPGLTNVILAGHATTVPDRAVLIGSLRTITDNTTVAVSCDDPCFLRVTIPADLALQAGGRGFESHHLHHYRKVPAQKGCRRPLTRLTGARCP